MFLNFFFGCKIIEFLLLERMGISVETRKNYLIRASERIKISAVTTGNVEKCVSSLFCW